MLIDALLILAGVHLGLLVGAWWGRRSANRRWERLVEATRSLPPASATLKDLGALPGGPAALRPLDPAIPNINQEVSSMSPMPRCESCRLPPTMLYSCGGCKRLVCNTCWVTVCQRHRVWQ